LDRVLCPVYMRHLNHYRYQHPWMVIFAFPSVANGCISFLPSTTARHCRFDTEYSFPQWADDLAGIDQLAFRRRCTPVDRRRARNPTSLDHQLIQFIQRNMNTLTLLSLSHRVISDRAIAAIHSLRELTDLDLRNIPLTNAQIQDLLKHCGPKLHRLRLANV